MTKKERNAKITLHARFLANCYRGLAVELAAAAAVLDQADGIDSRLPTVSILLFSKAIKRGVILHHLADREA